MSKLSVEMLPSLAKRAEAAAKRVGATPEILAQMGLNRACEEIESRGEIMAGKHKGFKTITVEVDERVAAALEWIVKTRNVKAEHLARYWVEWCALECIEQGRGEIVEPAISHAEWYAANPGKALEWLEYFPRSEEAA